MMMVFVVVSAMMMMMMPPTSGRDPPVVRFRPSSGLLQAIDAGPSSSLRAAASPVATIASGGATHTNRGHGARRVDDRCFASGGVCNDNNGHPRA
jgi:hypothetical protein